MSLAEKLRQKSVIKNTEIINQSKIFANTEEVATSVLGLNLALSGRLDGGVAKGMTMIAGPSRHFKTLFGLLMVKAYLDRHPDAVCLFYDCEFGTPIDYFSNLGIDLDRVVHTPVSDIEELKFDIMQQLGEEGIEEKDNVIIFMDSIGSIASKKEVEDAKDQKSVADMTRAKALKSLFRMVTPRLNIRNIPLVCINHVYAGQGMYARDTVSGGSGPMYSANTILTVTKAMEREGTDLIGWRFTVMTEKSRNVRERAKVPISVLYEGGIDNYTGLFELAQATGDLYKSSRGWYKRKLKNGEEDAQTFRAGDCKGEEFWNDLFDVTNFKENVEDGYRIGGRTMVNIPPINDEEIPA